MKILNFFVGIKKKFDKADDYNLQLRINIIEGVVKFGIIKETQYLKEAIQLLKEMKGKEDEE